MDKYLDVFFKYENNFKFPSFYLSNDSLRMLDEAFESNSFFKANLFLQESNEDGKQRMTTID